MTQQHDDGGAAFPRNGQNHLDTQDGMSLRDWFAGQALANPRTFPTDWTCTQEIADQAYAVADTMLAARLEGKP